MRGRTCLNKDLLKINFISMNVICNEKFSNDHIPLVLEYDFSTKRVSSLSFYGWWIELSKYTCHYFTVPCSVFGHVSNVLLATHSLTHTHTHAHRHTHLFRLTIHHIWFCMFNSCRVFQHTRAVYFELKQVKALNKSTRIILKFC